jgi:Ca-activated chloride channel family protein
MIDATDYYAILGVSRDVTNAGVRDAFAELLSRFPPDSSEEKDPEYDRILRAYNVLSDPERRATYDSLIVESAVSALTVKIQASRSHIETSETAQLLYILVDVLPPTSVSDSQRPLNLSLVIDRSTSMKGERLDHVKSAIELLIDKLGPDDIISVISFSDRPEVVVPSGTIINKKTLLQKIRNITASGGTEIYQGLFAGVQELHRVPLPQHTNHLILLTDGHTYGDTDKCLLLAEQSARAGVDFSAFGIGTEWNDQFLDKLVSPSSGQSQYIEAPTQIIDYLQERITGLGSIHARNLRLSLDFPKTASAEFGFKLSPFAQPLSLVEKEIKLGNIEGRRPLSILLEFNIEPQPIETRLQIPLNFTADLPGQQKYTFKHHHQLIVLEKAPAPEPVPDLIKAVRLLNMYRMNEKVLDDVEAGYLDMATRRMKHLSTRLLEMGQTKLAQQAHAEGERLSTMGDVSGEGRKKLKYGTRALLAQTIAALELDQNDQV